MANLIPEQKILAKHLEMQAPLKIEPKMKKVKTKITATDHDWQKVTPLIYPVTKRLDRFKEMKEEVKVA